MHAWSLCTGHADSQFYLCCEQAVKSSLRLKCLCHGLSRSCNFQTCHYEMKSWDEVGMDLKTMYDDAVVVTLNENDDKLVKNGRQEVSSSSLVYFNSTKPSLCEGTKDRLCSLTSTAENSCNSLCCGRGYTTVEDTVKHACNCQLKMFPPPIGLKCDTCFRKIELKYCT
eukprot:m.6320 g.6320  ORF g.6320 m.6320 type:complete len:169 (+) comp15540_c0_seq1:793-1299(+)